MLTLNGTEIDARTPYEAKDTVKAVPGGRWVPADKVWRFPASPYCSRQLVDALGQYGVSDEVHEIASKWITVNDIIARINSGETVEVSELMKFNPRSNQVVGAMMGRLMQGFILGWGMGAGKTYGTLSCIADEIDRFIKGGRQGPIPMFFISAPATVVQGVWPGEVKKHLVGWRDYLEVSALKKGSSTAQRLKDASRRLQWAERDKKAFLFVCGHEASWRETISSFIKAHEWDLAAIDEIHRVETPGAKITRWVDTVLAPRARRRIGLTGTLFRKDELDAFCPVRFVEPGIFGRSAAKFKNEHALIDHFGRPAGPKNAAVLRDMIGLVTHFVNTRDVVDLPPFTEVTRRIELTKEGRKAYEQMEQHQVLEVSEGTLTASNGLSKLLRLQQITSGYLRVETEDGGERGVEVDDAKRVDLEEFIESMPIDQPLVVFTMFKSDVRYAKAACMNQGRTSYQLDGDADELKLWQDDDEPSVLIANIQSAGVGVDMTRACYGYFFSCGFSHPNYDQACRRLDRPGQTQPVTIYHAIANNTVDEAVAASLEAKGNAIGAAIDYLRGKYDTLTTETYQ